MAVTSSSNLGEVVASIGEETTVSAAVLLGGREPLRLDPSQMQQARVESARSHRDAVVEDELFHVGYFADVAFSFRDNPTGDVDVVYGQSALFALLSPTLRELLGTEWLAAEAGLTPEMTVAPSCAASRAGIRPVWLGPEFTARAFREVARYVYSLPLQLTGVVLPELITAAHALKLPELQTAAFVWGLARLGERAGQDVGEPHLLPMEGAAASSIGGDECDGENHGIDVSDALRCLDQLLALSEPRPPDAAVRWRDALVRAFSAEAVFSSNAFSTIRLDALEAVLVGMADNADPCIAWTASVRWASARCADAREVTADTTSCVPRPLPRRMFGPSSRGNGLTIGLPSPCPTTLSGPAVEWQRCLIPAARAVRFAGMAAADFAMHVEALDPMLPELRQVIYASRRQDLRGNGSEPASGQS